MTDLHWLALLAIMAALHLLLLFRPRNLWSDSDYYALVQKYSDAASQLTSMKAELDSLREKLELSEDVRLKLGMDNAKLAEEIGQLNKDIGKGEDLRYKLIEMLCDSHVAKGAAEHRLETTQRSLRIARHKEFKRWKKGRRFIDQEWWPVNAPASWHNSIRIRRALAHPSNMKFTKSVIREYISIIRTMEPYPLP